MGLVHFFILALALTVQPTPVKRDREGRDDGSSDLENSRKRVRVERRVERVRAEDIERIDVVEEVLDNSNLAAAVDVIMPRIEEWFVQKPFDANFSAVTESSSIFEKLAEYVADSEGVERGSTPGAPFVYSYENVTTVAFAPEFKSGIGFSRIFRASEHGFLAAEFRRVCIGKGPTITLVKSENGRMAAFYNSGEWTIAGDGWLPNPKGFIASINSIPDGYAFQKFVANGNARAGTGFMETDYCPTFGRVLQIGNNYAFSESLGGLCAFGRFGFCGMYSRVGAPETWELVPLLFESTGFRISEYEVFQVNL
jgi:hypothetical protein